MTEWNELCFPQYLKMYDPTNKEEKDDEYGKDCNDEVENENQTTNKEEGYENDENVQEPEDDALESSKFEKDQVKYGQEVKFHYLITKTGERGKALPNLMKLENAYPGEPKFLRKRRHPKSLRFYKVKEDLNPIRFFLHELMMYKSFGPEEYERWHDDEKCIEDYEKYSDSIKNVKKVVMEWIEDVEEARYFVEEAMKHDVDVEETGETLDPEKHKEDLECDNDGKEEDEQDRHLDPAGLKDLDFPAAGNWYRKLELLDKNVLEKQTCMLDVWQRKVVDNGLKFVRGLKKFANGFDSLPAPENMVVIGGEIGRASCRERV